MNNGYRIAATIEGTAPLLQHAFGADALKSVQQQSSKHSGVQDYNAEFLETMYVNSEGLICQPANHIEGSMVKAAINFKIKGLRGKTFKDLVRGYAFVEPELIPHLYNGGHVTAPDETLLLEPTDHLSVSIMRVRVQRAAVARQRLQLATGWRLSFVIAVIDPQLPADVLGEILQEAGRAVGIGDYRPRFGRFQVSEYELL